jgi:folate-binding protein YgfZ
MTSSTTKPLPNPLHDLHRQAEAEFQPYGDIEVVSTFGEPQAEYAAIRKSCGMIDLPQRGILEVAGKDRHAFLNNLLTNQLWDKQAKQPLESGRWIYAFLLNLKGRIVCDFNVIEVGDRTLLEMDARLVEPVRQVLELYLFAEQVTLSSRVGALHQIALHGPRASEVLQQVLDTPQPVGQQGSCAAARMLGNDVVIWRDDTSAVPGLHLIVATAAARSIWMHLLTTFGQSDSAGAAPGKRPLRSVGWAAYNATRIEGGRALFGIDFDGAPPASAAPGKAQRDEADPAPSPGLLAAETGLFDRAVSVTKGCYLGQEIVARMHARKQVARQIAGIRMDGDALPLAGAQVFDNETHQVGIITSSTVSPVLSNSSICLGLLKRPFFNVGTIVSIPAEGGMRRGTVVELPFIKATQPEGAGS